jgi:hypothetical protein
MQERITSTKRGSITSVQAVYVPADDLTDPAPATTFAHLDATTVLSRKIADLGIYPAVDPLDSTSRILTPKIVGDQHYDCANRVKGILQTIVSSLAGFGILVILLALVLFSFYLQLMIAKSKDNLQLLLTLGYSPQWLSKTVATKWIPVYILIVIAALALTQLLHWGFHYFVMPAKEELSYLINWTVLLIAILLLILSILNIPI